jgi:integrase
VSEAVTLQWRNLVDGIVNVRGKGGRTRVVRLSRGTWAELQALRPRPRRRPRVPDDGLERVGPGAPRGALGRISGAGLATLPAAF